MIITEEFLKTLDPCRNGFRYWKKVNKKDLCDFMTKCIDDDNWDWGMWLLMKSVNASILADIAFFSAESVAHIFNKRRPNDKRIKKCIDKIKMFRKRGVGFKTLYKYAESAKEAAKDACNDCDEASFRSAVSVYSAAYAAFNASYFAKAAVVDAGYAIDSACDAVYAAARSYCWENSHARKDKREEIIDYLRRMI